MSDLSKTFGNETVAPEERQRRVRDLFGRIASRYDLMNDLMSCGIHRLWKRDLAWAVDPRAGQRVVDLAGGTGDVARLLTVPGCEVVVCDPCVPMMTKGRSRRAKTLRWLAGAGEALPFRNNAVDTLTIAFGIRNVTHVETTLREILRVLKPGGRLLCLEFSHPRPWLRGTYNAFSRLVIPRLGALVARDPAAYNYLLESIRRFPNQAEMKTLLERAGFTRVYYKDLSFGIACIHIGTKPDHANEDDSPVAWLQSAFVKYAQRTALVENCGTYDYATLYGRLGSLASRYAAAGFIAGEPTAIVSKHAERIAWGAYLALYCGCPVLPLGPEHTDPAHLLQACGITQLIADKGVKVSLPARLRYFSSEWLSEPTDDPLLSPSPASVTAVQLFVATSGVSAKPRAVMLTGDNLTASVHASRQRIRLEPDDVWLNCLPLVHIGGFMILLRCAYAGATVVLHEEFDARRVWMDLIERAVTHISLVPAMLAGLLDHCSDQPPPSHLRCVLVGGSPLSATLAKRARDAGWPLIVTYGMSETASHVTLYDLDGNWAPGNVGKTLCGARVQIIDDTGGDYGRIRIDGPMVMAGYANAEGAHGIGVSNGAYTSNDLGCVDDDGQLHVLGRVDDILISGGMNIHPQEVEEKLLTCPGVQDVAVTARHDDTWGDILIGLIVGPVSEQDFDQWCRVNLSSALRPREVVKVDRLPRDRLGKLKRRTLPRLIPAGLTN